MYHRCAYCALQNISLIQKKKVSNLGEPCVSSVELRSSHYFLFSEFYILTESENRGQQPCMCRISAFLVNSG